MKAETKLRVAACAAGFALPRYNDLPSVGLYLDQTVQFVNGYFRSFCGVELTPSMVSNYVKKGVVDHPIRKKYTRDQIASLMYTLFKMQREHCSAGTAYDIFCEELETSLSVVFGGKTAQPEITLNDERLLLRSTIFAAVNKIYLDCCFDALRQEQALWSDILPDLA